MKNLSSIIGKSTTAIALAAIAVPSSITAAEITGMGDFKIFIDPGHSGRENQGMWGYSEAQKVLQIALFTQDYLTKYTDINPDNIKLCRYTQEETVGLEERSDMANAWGADFYYSIHSDAGATTNTIVTLFGGWKNAGVEIEKTPNGGKKFGEYLEPNLSGVMRIGSRGNWYDQCYYNKGAETTNQWPYLSVNRRSNMASILSEGGFHTIADQQQLNINADWKRLEALAAFHSILQYRGLPLPNTTALVGIIRNSENNQPINGVKVTVGDLTYTTDTWETTFKPYTNNPDVIHNGFYYFEGLAAESVVDVTFECDGFETLTKQVTIKKGGITTADFVTYLDVEMTNIAPAKVSSINLNDLNAVSPVYPLVITFSRTMDRASVEQALSINNNGKISLNWINDYTLEVNLNELLPLWDYTITIDGEIAKNALTGQKFDGDGDGVEGGAYNLTFIMAEPDLTAPVIVNTYPATDGEAVYTMRPVIGVEFDEEINFNADKDAECLVVTDKDGNVYTGTLTHAVNRGRSFFQYHLDQDLPLDKAFLVTIKAGLTDLSGNVTENLYFRFLSEYRKQTSYTTLHSFDSFSDWWEPEGSGSTKGIVAETSNRAASTLVHKKGDAGAMAIDYVFDMASADQLWQIREYWKGGTSYPFTVANQVMTAWVYGDASNNTIGMRGRANGSAAGIKYRDPETTIDFLGWRLIHWNFDTDSWAAFTGSETEITKFYFDSMFLSHMDTDPDDETIPYQEWEGRIIFDELGYGVWENAERTAQIEDVTVPSSGIESIITPNNSNAPVEYFNLQGIKVNTPQAGQLLIRRQGTTVTKVLVK